VIGGIRNARHAHRSRILTRRSPSPALGNSNASPPRWQNRVSWLFGLLVFAAVVTFAIHSTEIGRFLEIARNARPVWLLAAIALQAGTYFAAAGVWWIVLWHRGQRHAFLSLVPLGLVKLFTDQALPTGGVGGTAVVIQGLIRRRIPSGIAASALLLGMVSYYTAYAGAVAAALVLVYFERLLDGTILAAAGIFACVVIAVPTIVLSIRRNIQRWPFSAAARIRSLMPLLEAIRSAKFSLRDDWLPFLISTLLQLAVFLLDAATLWAALRAVGSDASAASAFASFMSASVAATIGPIPLGLGTFEAAAVATLHLQGQPLAVALTATLLLRGLTFWIPMLPGLLLARRELGNQARTGDGR
jgi:hypothetical protein